MYVYVVGVTVNLQITQFRDERLLSALQAGLFYALNEVFQDDVPLFLNNCGVC